MYDKTVRRRRAALLIFVALSIGLLTVYFGESADGGLHAIQRGAQEVLAPIEEGASRAFKPFRDAINWFGDVFDAKSENEKLKDEDAELREDLAAAQTAQREAEQLRSLVDLPKDELFPQGTEPVTARIIARSPTSLAVERPDRQGLERGIEEDMPVIAPGGDGGGGLAGKVTSVSGGTATVTLITDESSAVSAQVMPDGAAGIVKPTVGDPSDMLLDFIEKGRPVSEDTTVITSGSRSDRFESLFPRGIPIGRVTEVDAEERELYQRVHIEPFADLHRMDFVQVLTQARAGAGGAAAVIPGISSVVRVGADDPGRRRLPDRVPGPDPHARRDRRHDAAARRSGRALRRQRPGRRYGLLHRPAAGPRPRHEPGRVLARAHRRRLRRSAATASSAIRPTDSRRSR